MISPFLTHPIGRPRKTVASDPQREKLYKLEREIIGQSVYHVVSNKDLKTVADHVCRYYKLPAIKVIVVNKPKLRDLGWCDSFTLNGSAPFGFTITLNKGFHGANVSILLHEMAHYVTDTAWKGHQDHGPEFMGVYVHLMSKYRIVPSDCFRLLALRHGIHVGTRYKPHHIGT